MRLGLRVHVRVGVRRVSVVEGEDYVYGAAFRVLDAFVNVSEVVVDQFSLFSLMVDRLLSVALLGFREYALHLLIEAEHAATALLLMHRRPENDLIRRRRRHLVGRRVGVLIRGDDAAGNGDADDDAAAGCSLRRLLCPWSVWGPWGPAVRLQHHRGRTVTFG